MLGYVGYRLLIAPSGWSRLVALTIWFLTQVSVAGFPVTLFRRKRVGEATEVSAVCAEAAIGSVAASAKVDRWAVGRSRWNAVGIVGLLCPAPAGRNVAT